MIIINQNRDRILYVEKFDYIEAYEFMGNWIISMKLQDNEMGMALGVYETEKECKDILLQIFNNSVGKYAMPLSLKSIKDEKTKVSELDSVRTSIYNPNLTYPDKID